MKQIQFFLVVLSILITNQVALAIIPAACKAVKEVYYLDTNDNFIENIVSNNEPILIRNLPFLTDWRAFSVWSNKTYLNEIWSGSNNSHIIIKRQINRSIFTLLNPTLNFDPFVSRQHYSFQNVTVSSFLHKIFEDDEQIENVSYQYFAGELPLPLQNDISNEFLKVKHVTKSKSHNMLWIGSEGVETQIHYDVS